MYVFTKKNVYKYLYINPLPRIHNTSLISAYFGLDSRECKCLEYLYFIITINNWKVSKSNVSFRT
jgi:hypothetical protein